MGDALSPEAVLKLLHLDGDEEFDKRAYEVHRVDAVISQRLTSSPHVIDIHGYCGMSALYEKGQYSLDDGYENFALNEKYQMVLQVARGMADIHGIDYPAGNNATIAHRDLKPHNLMMFPNGKVKYGDFNDSHLQQWNKTSGQPCPFYNRGYPTYWGLGYKPSEHSAEGYPKLTENFQLTRFDSIAERYLERPGLEPVVCATEDEARSRVAAVDAGEETIEHEEAWHTIVSDED